GLEFPFVICVTRDISRSHSDRNSLYMMLTRSFIRSYLLLGDRDESLQAEIQRGLENINAHGYMEITIPPQDVIERIRTTIKFDEKSISHYDLVSKVFDDLNIEAIFRPSLYEIVKNILPDSFDVERISKVILFNYEEMLQETK
ncbi:DNA helicase, partial [Escherichia coli]|nr:DNA helicase [Escherichia coli]